MGKVDLWIMRICHSEPLLFSLYAGAGDLHLFPVSVKTQSGEKLELQVSYLL